MVARRQIGDLYQWRWGCRSATRTSSSSFRRSRASDQRRMARKLRRRGKEAQSGSRRRPERAPTESDTDSDLYSEPATPDSSDSSESDCKLRLEFTVTEAQNFIVSNLCEGQVLNDYLRSRNDWDRLDGPNVKREMRAAAFCILRETGWQGIFQAAKEEIRAVDLLRLSRRG